MREELLGPNWLNAFINSGHSFIASDYINDIASALEEYGQNQGYSISSQFYKDLAWGGLTHYDPNNDQNFVESPWFKSAFSSSADRNRILNVINAEQNGTYQKKGENAGC